MKRIKILKIIFEQEIKPYQVSKLRGAIANLIGNDGVLFHNHLSDNKLRYSYPLIQYKIANKKATLICIDKGTNEVNMLFNKDNLDIDLEGTRLNLTINSLNANYHIMQVWDKFFNYSIVNWLGLNSKNYEIYNKMDSEVERIQFLEKILVGNILSMAKGLGINVDKKIELKIQKIESSRVIKYKDADLTVFNMKFKANFFIPNNLGLGKGVSHGYGNVREIKKYKRDE